MAITILSKAADDKSTFVISCAYKDHNGDAVTPNSANWSLFDDAGNTINSRSSVSIATPSTSNDVFLSGDDLAYTDGDKRRFLLEFVYTVSATSYTVRDECQFNIQDTVGVS